MTHYQYYCCMEGIKAEVDKLLSLYCHSTEERCTVCPFILNDGNCGLDKFNEKLENIL